MSRESASVPAPRLTVRELTTYETLSVREILKFPAVKRAVPEVLAGAELLDRPVRWIHSGDAPHIASMLKGGELLLTTGMGMGASATEQRRFAAGLSRRHIAAMAMELGSRYRSVPEPLVEEARRNELIVIALNREVPFVEITEAVLSEMVSQQVGKLRQSEEMHQRFFRLALEGAGTTDILAALAEITGTPVFLQRSGHGLLYHVAADRSDSDDLARWDAYERRLRQAPAAVEQRVPLGDDPEWGRLVALFSDRTPTESDRAALERAVEVVSLALMRDREEEAVRSGERGNFLSGLLRGDFDEGTARTRAAELGMSSHSAYVPIALMRSPHLAARAGETASWHRVWSDFQSELADRSFGFLAGTREHGRELICVVGTDEPEARRPVADRIAAIASEAGRRRLGEHGVVLVCVGAAASDWEELSDCLRALVERASIAPRLPARPWHDLSTPNLDQLLWSLRGREELSRFSRERIGPLLEYDRLRRASLTATLTAYCRNAGRKAETARALGIERQSLYHRLKRIDELLDVDLASGDTLTELHIALRVSEVMEADSGQLRRRDGDS